MENDADVEDYLQTVADMMETDKGNDTSCDQSYRCGVESALSQVTANKREMCLTLKENNFARNMHFLLKYSKDIVTQQEQEEQEEEGKGSIAMRSAIAEAEALRPESCMR